MSTENYIVSFPTYEARDAFYESLRAQAPDAYTSAQLSRALPTVTIHDVSADDLSHLERIAGEDASFVSDEQLVLHR